MKGLIVIWKGPAKRVSEVTHMLADAVGCIIYYYTNSMFDKYCNRLVATECGSAVAQW